MVKRILLLSILFTFIGSPLAHAAVFKDVAPSHPAYISISFLSDKGVISGYKDGTFQSTTQLNKAEPLKLILSTTNTTFSDTITETPFSDVKKDDWFAKYVVKGKELGIVSGNDKGLFQPTKLVSRAEFFKMLLKAHKFKEDGWKDKSAFADVATTDWFAPYLNFAGASGILLADSNKKLYPTQILSRGEVAESLYLLVLILKASDPAFLIKQAEAHLVQIEHYMNATNTALAKRSAEIAVDLTQQALSSKPGDNVVISAAKIAKAYDAVLSGFIAGLEKKKQPALDAIAIARTKADEAVKANKETASIAEHIKKRAKEIEEQVSKLK